jgi:hypothetical protein
LFIPRPGDEFHYAHSALDALSSLSIGQPALSPHSVLATDATPFFPLEFGFSSESTAMRPHIWPDPGPPPFVGLPDSFLGSSRPSGSMGMGIPRQRSIMMLPTTEEDPYPSLPASATAQLHPLPSHSGSYQPLPDVVSQAAARAASAAVAAFMNNTPYATVPYQQMLANTAAQRRTYDQCTNPAYMQAAASPATHKASANGSSASTGAPVLTSPTQRMPPAPPSAPAFPSSLTLANQQSFVTDASAPAGPTYSAALAEALSSSVGGPGLSSDSISWNSGIHTAPSGLPFLPGGCGFPLPLGYLDPPSAPAHLRELPAILPASYPSAWLRSISLVRDRHCRGQV